MTTTLEKTKSILDHLSDLLSHGWLYYFCGKSLDEAYSKNRIASSRFFFMGCYYACLNETILAISKLFIEHSDSITIYYLLNHAKANPKTFPNASAKDVILAVKKHGDKLRKFDELKSTLKFQRDRKLAHFDRKHINNPSEILSNPELDMNEVEECYREIHRTINTFYRFSADPELSLLNIEEDVPEDLGYLLESIEVADRYR